MIFMFLPAFQSAPHYHFPLDLNVLPLSTEPSKLTLASSFRQCCLTVCQLYRLNKLDTHNLWSLTVVLPNSSGSRELTYILGSTQTIRFSSNEFESKNGFYGEANRVATLGRKDLMTWPNIE
jgi:hypothetical protein